MTESVVDITKIAKFGGRREWQIVAPDGVKSDPLSLAKSVFREAELVDEAFTEAVEAIRADEELSPLGKRNKRAAAVAGHLESIARLRVEQRQVAAAFSTAVEKAKEKASASVEDKVASLLIGAETRRILQDQHRGDPLAIVVAYRAALAAGDVQTLDAIETSPSIWPGRPDADQLEELKAERMAQLEPELDADLRYLRDAAKDTDLALNAVEREIRSVGGVQVDEIADLAAGQTD